VGTAENIASGMTEEAKMQQEKINKLKQNKNIELEHNLTNMLIHLYNGK
jgi:hypothetical protein